MYSVRVKLKVTSLPSEADVEFEDHSPVRIGTERTVVYFDVPPDDIWKVKLPSEQKKP